MVWPRVGGLRSLELGTPGELRTWLNALALSGAKTATTGLFDDYARAGEALETVGERLVLLDSEGRPAGTVEITGVEVRPFAEVPWEHAKAEGEGDTSLERWRANHRRYWADAGTEAGDDTLVVCLAFRLLTPAGTP